MKKTAKKTTKVSKKVTQPAYHAFIKVMGKEYEASGSSLSEAIKGLKPEGLARGVTVLRIIKGEQREEKILPKLATVRLFAPSQLVREIALKNTIERFSI